jgi:hypothetical protein
MSVLKRAPGKVLVGALAVASMLAFAGSASAQTAAPGWAVSDYATAFPFDPASNVGPVGLAFDGNGTLYAVDFFNGDFSRYAPGGGTEPTHVVTNNPAFKNTGSLANASNHLLLAGNAAPGIMDINPITGAIERTILTGDRYGPMAVDPVSGQLYAVTVGTATPFIRGIFQLNTTSPSTQNYASALMPDGKTLAGITVDDHGNIYGVTMTHVWLIPRTGTAPTLIATIAPGGESIQYSPGNDVIGPYVVVNRTVGLITKVDLHSGAQTNIVSDGSRGDNSTVGPDHCLYADQTDRILRVTKAGGACDFSAPFAPVADTLTADPIVAQVLPNLSINLGKLTAHLKTRSGQPISDRLVTFSVADGTVLCQAITDASGTATCGNIGKSLNALVNTRYNAYFAGDGEYAPAFAQGKIAVVAGIGIL